MLRRLSILLAALALLAACGAPAAPAPPTSPPSAAPAPTTAPASPAQASISVEHPGGTLTLDQPASRVVACSEEALDFLIALDVRPVGFCSDRISDAASGEPYELPHFFPSEKIGAPTFVGAATTPSAELIAALAPDLIISTDYTEGNEQLAQIAPTYVLSVDAPGYWRETLQGIGELLGRSEQAEQFLAEYDATVERLAAATAPIAAESPNLLLVYSFGASDGTVLLGNAWTGSRPFTQLGFTVLEPEGVSFSNGIAPISPETVAQAEADIIFVLRPALPDGTRPSYPLDELLATRDDARVIYQVFPSTRGSTAPYTDRFVLEEVAGLLSSPAAGAASFPRTITHAGGETTLQAPAQRVVALEWTYVEDLLALGVQPVGVADIGGYGDWVQIPAALDGAVADVGTRQEPSLEQIAALNPDLILVPAFRAAANLAQLQAIAPTLAFDPYPTEGPLTQYDEMLQTFTTIAQAVGREAEGAAVLARMERSFAAQAERIAAAGEAGAPFVLAQAYSSGGGAEVRLFTENAMATQIVERLGLENAWADAAFQQYGFSTVSVEALPQLGEAHFFYVVQDDDDVFAAEAARPLWQSLPFVRAGNAHPLGGDTWLFGGPLSAELLATLVADSLLAAD